MALAEVAPTPDEDAAFVASVARNIRVLLAMRDMQAQDLAAALRMSPSKLSQRMSGYSRWLGVELRRVAQAFDVDTDVIFAMTEGEFREALTRSRCSSGTGRSERWLHPVPDLPEEPEQGELF